MIATPRCVLCMQLAFFLATKSLSCSELIFPVSLAYYLSVCPVCSVLLQSDWFGQHTVGGWGRGAEKNRAIKRFRNRAISNRDFISISINRTALLQTFPTEFPHMKFKGLGFLTRQTQEMQGLSVMLGMCNTSPSFSQLASVPE